MELHKYYVYAILDPRKNIAYNYLHINFTYQPFYIGYGQKNRINDHLSKRELKQKSLKNNKIKSIIKDGFKPIFIKLVENLTFEAANELEIDLIKHFGRINLKTGCLSNLTDGGGGVKQIILTESMLLKRSENSMGVNNPFYGKKHDMGTFSLCKKVLQIDLTTGDIINEYISCSEAERITGILHIDLVCRGGRITAGGYKWRFKENYSNESNIKHKPKKCGDIYQMDIQGNIIAKFASAAEASRHMDIDRSNISLCLSGKRKTAGGYKWKYV